MASLVGQWLTVHKNDSFGHLVRTWEGLVVADDEELITIEAEFTYGTVDLGLFVLERGDLFRETYYFTRWWNVFEVHRHDGSLRGWYCNVTRPPRLAGCDLHYDDLALDLLVSPAGEVRIDDEGEFLALRLDERDPQAYREARRAVAQIRARVGRRYPPFQALHRPSCR